MTEATVTPIRPVHHHQTGLHRDANNRYVVTCACGFQTPGCSSETSASHRWNVHKLTVELEAATS